MTLQEVFNNHSQYQAVLSFSNNNEVLITDDCFCTDSKFFRRSKVRLGVDFVMSGVIQGDVFIHTTDSTTAGNSNAIIYRTYRGTGKSDYVLYIYKGEYKLLEHFKKTVSHKRIITQTSKQMTLNSITQPAPDKVLDICPHVDNMDYWVSYRNNGLKSGVYYSPLYKNTMPYSYLGYMAGVLVGLSVAKKYAGRINQVRIFHPDDNWSRGVYMFPLKKWRPKNSYTQDYVYRIEQLKKELQVLGISICFMK